MLNGKTKRYLGYGKEKNDFQSFRFLRTRAKKRAAENRMQNPKEF